MIELFEDQAESKRVELCLDSTPEVDRWFLGDEGKLSQVIINLISNAIKFSPALSQILITVKVMGELAILCVKDQGLGIKE